MTVVMLDLDLTLLKSLEPDEDEYESYPGKLVKTKNKDFKTLLRPHIDFLLASIKDLGYRYIVWSAGTFYYVHAVVKYIQSKYPEFQPEEIYTANDLVKLGADLYKHLDFLGYQNVIILEDNPDAIIQEERNRIIYVNPWQGNAGDRELIRAGNLMRAHYEVFVRV